MNICYANTIDYDFDLQQRPHHLMNILASRGYNIHWVNKTQIKNKKPDRYDNLTIYHDWDVFKKRHKNKIDILFCAWSERHIDVAELHPRMVIFDNVDNFSDWASTDDIMCQKADVILATSTLLYKEKRQRYKHKKVVLCQNGCLSKYNKTEIEVPKDILNIKTPRLLFSGALAYWCDLNIIKILSKDYNIIFVGKPWGIDFDDIKNHLHYLGIKTHSELQGYYKYCDVNLLPFKRCEIADFSNPIKTYEASVFGTPTVAINIPDVVNHEPAILTYKKPNQLLYYIKKAIKYSADGKIRENIMEFATNNDWEKRVDIIEDQIKQYFNSHPQDGMVIR